MESANLDDYKLEGELDGLKPNEEGLIDIPQRYTKIILSVRSATTNQRIDLSTHDLTNNPPNIKSIPPRCEKCSLDLLKVLFCI
jgi:hypothetical protein